jgi:hypothetical protein
MATKVNKPSKHRKIESSEKPTEGMASISVLEI